MGVLSTGEHIVTWNVGLHVWHKLVFHVISLFNAYLPLYNCQVFCIVFIHRICEWPMFKLLKPSTINKQVSCLLTNWLKYTKVPIIVWQQAFNKRHDCSGSGCVTDGGIDTGITYLTSISSRTLVSFVRILYVQPADRSLTCRLMYTPPGGFSYKTFVPSAVKVAMCSGTPQYEPFTTTWKRSRAWLKAVGQLRSIHAGVYILLIHATHVLFICIHVGIGTLSNWFLRS